MRNVHRTNEPNQGAITMTQGIPYVSIPNGWFVVGTSGELGKGKILERRYFGKEWVLWRDASGEAHFHEAYCPHLGAHLGDGCVKGNSLRCPFHGFEFSGEGACVSTPYGKKPPPRARLVGLPVREQNGLLLA
jgi:phenylpropionate dioxygenase-like ring-hydroxylating dioxygenase large terminal subunit